MVSGGCGWVGWGSTKAAGAAGVSLKKKTCARILAQHRGQGACAHQSEVRDRHQEGSAKAQRGLSASRVDRPPRSRVTDRVPRKSSKSSPFLGRTEGQGGLQDKREYCRQPWARRGVMEKRGRALLSSAACTYPEPVGVRLTWASSQAADGTGSGWVEAGLRPMALQPSVCAAASGVPGAPS